jgi:hypothetical protein
MYQRRANPEVAAAIILGTIGVLSFIVQPGLVQGFVTQYGLSEAGANALAFDEMLGIAVATVLAALIGSRLSWRTQAIAALIVSAIGHALSGLASGGEWLSVARLIAGLGCGFVISISFSVVGAGARPERNLGLYLVLLLTYGAFGLWELPRILDTFGLDSVFYCWAAITFAGIAAALKLPDGPASNSAEPAQKISGDDTRTSIVPILLVLAGVLTYNFSIGVAWANLFLIGIDAGIAEQPIADALLICQFTAVGGALGAVWLAGRSGQLWPVIVGTVGGAAAMTLTLGALDYGEFLLVLIVFNTLWNFALPFILGLAAALHPSGRLISMAIACQMIGLAIGPLAASHLLGGAAGFEPVKILSIATMVLTLAFFAWPLMVVRRNVQSEC